jgi:hypothetical protein
VSDHPPEFSDETQDIVFYTIPALSPKETDNFVVSKDESIPHAVFIIRLDLSCMNMDLLLALLDNTAVTRCLCTSLAVRQYDAL